MFRLPSMSQCMILFANLKRPGPLVSRVMYEHTRPVNNAFIQTNRFPEATRVRSGKKQKERRKESDIESKVAAETLSPGSFAQTALPLRTARHDRADSYWSTLHPSFLGSAFNCHAPSSSHGTGALEHRSGAWAKHTSHAIVLLTPHHPPRVAG